VFSSPILQQMWVSAEAFSQFGQNLHADADIRMESDRSASSAC